MSYFNYRVVCKQEPVNDLVIPIEYEDTYSIFEVYYSESGDITAISAEPYDVMSYNESVNDLADSIKKLEDALNLSVLHYEEVISDIESKGFHQDW